MVYLIVFLIFLYPILKRSSLKNNISPYYFVFQCIVLILVAGLRNQVGGDTIGYMRDWDRIDDIFHIDTYTMLYMSLYYRPLTLGIMLLCRTISTEFFVWQLVLAIFVNISVFYIINKEAKYKYETAMLYLLFQFLYFNMEIMRESMAVCAFYFAFCYYDKKQWIKYYLSIVVVFLLHDSVFIFFFLPLVDKILEKKFNFVTLLAFFVIGTIAFDLLMPILANLLPGKRGSEFQEGYGAWENASIWGSLRSCLMVFIYYIILKYEERRQSTLVIKGYKIFIIFSIWGILLPVISVRMSNYVKLFSYIVFADYIWYYKRQLMQKVLICALFLSFFRYYFKDVTDWVETGGSERYYFYECFYPYSSIFEDPDQEAVERRTKIYDQEEIRKYK